VDAEAAVASVELPSQGDGAQRPTITVAENPVQERALFAYDLPANPTTATLRIYNVAGKLLFVTALALDENEYEWDLVTSSGNPLASGLYLYVLLTETGSSEIGRLVIER
jgi:hypothetical protein